MYMWRRDTLTQQKLPSSCYQLTNLTFSLTFISNTIRGCLAERSKAPDSRVRLLAAAKMQRTLRYRKMREFESHSNHFLFLTPLKYCSFASSPIQSLSIAKMAVNGPALSSKQNRKVFILFNVGDDLRR
ncbi:uncharacterized protein ZBAI_03429 [Zygosaccharomyces bailii ISA1307]|nr:uncharacterized protein ZBAI_03429 [Zygosaccharomyces bailii ISA1307]